MVQKKEEKKIEIEGVHALWQTYSIMDKVHRGRWQNAGEGLKRPKWQGNAKAEMTKIVKHMEKRADESLHLVLHESVTDAR